MHRLHGQVALVTGGAVRIGAAIAEALADAGATLVIHHRHSGAAAAALAARLGGPGAPHFTVAADLTDLVAAAALPERVRALTGRLDVLVNNAAVFHPRGIADTDAAALTGEFQVNLFAPFVLLRAFAAGGGAGQVINLLDRRITASGAGATAYTLTKQALAGLTRAAALEFAPRIRVNAVAPGVVLPPVGVARIGARRIAAVPLGRAVSPAEVGAAVVFLAENEALTGQILFVDGGEHLGPPGDPGASLGREHT